MLVKSYNQELAVLDDIGRAFTDSAYLVDRSVLKLVFIFGIKNETVVFNEADDRCLPSWTLQEGDQAIEDPILCICSVISQIIVFFLHAHLQQQVGAAELTYLLLIIYSA